MSLIDAFRSLMDPRSLDLGDPHERELHAWIAHADRALRPSVDVRHAPSGDGFAVGELTFANADDARTFVARQRDLWSHLTPDERTTQLQTLARVERGGLDAVADAPRTSAHDVDALLAQATRDADGDAHFGTLTVKHDDVAAFVDAQRGLAATNPEAVAVLDALMHRAQPTTLDTSIYVGADNAHAGESAGGPLTIGWNPASMMRVDGVAHAPAVGLLHEEAHAIEDPIVRATLNNIPDRQYGSLEERRVIGGVEARHLATIGLPPRTDHLGDAFATDAPNGTHPVLPYTDEQGAHVLASGPLAGRFTSATPGPKADILDDDLLGAQLRFTSDDGHAFSVRFDALNAAATPDFDDTYKYRDALRHHDHLVLSVERDGIRVNDPDRFQAPTNA